MATTPEGKVKDAARKLYQKHGAKYDRAVANGMGQNGRADDIVCRGGDGHFGGVEFKKLDVWRVTALQRIWLTDTADRGGSAMVVNETNLGMLERWLQRPGTRVIAEFDGDVCVRHWAFVPGCPPHEIKNPALPGKAGKHRAGVSPSRL